MTLRQWLALASLAAILTGCSLAGQRRVRSQAGSVAHGEFVTVPYGTVDDWNIVVTPMQMGVEESGSEEDNRLLGFRVSAAVQDPTHWQITALYRFGYAMDNQNIHWVEGSANYLIVPK